MASTCTFDQWQKDAFFYAAEAVQESADIMESVHRMWIRDRAEGSKSEISDELRRELHAALGTAKWQLEEFERAVKESHGNCSPEDNSIARHRQFVAAIECQISSVEKSLCDSLAEEGKQPLRWVQLDDEERDDLAMFLSAAPLQEATDKYENIDAGSSQKLGRPGCLKGFKETVTIDNDSKYVVELEAKELSKTKGKACDQGELVDEKRRTWSSPDIGSWKIVISDEEDTVRKSFETKTAPPSRAFNLCSLARNVEVTAKSKWLRSSFRKEKSGEHLHLKQGISSYFDLKRVTRFSQGRNVSNERNKTCLNSFKEDLENSRVQQICRQVGGLKRQGTQYYMQFSRSLRMTFLLVLSIFLIVPFVFYSN